MSEKQVDSNEQAYGPKHPSAKFGRKLPPRRKTR